MASEQMSLCCQGFNLVNLPSFSVADPCWGIKHNNHYEPQSISHCCLTDEALWVAALTHASQSASSPCRPQHTWNGVELHANTGWQHRQCRRIFTIYQHPQFQHKIVRTWHQLKVKVKVTDVQIFRKRSISKSISSAGWHVI